MAKASRRAKPHGGAQARWRLLGATVLALMPAAQAFDLQSLEQGQEKLFPGRRLAPADFKLSPDQYSHLKADFHVPAMRPAIKAWQVEGGGWLYLDQVWGRDDIVTYLVAVSAAGKLLGIEMLVCADGYCDQYTRQWRAQLIGRTAGDWQPGDAVNIVSGATLSCTHVAEGVKKILAIHARYRPGSTAPSGG